MPQSRDGNNKTVGAAGENAAALFLQNQGFQIIDANVRPLGGMKRGEIDLIAWDGDCLVFVEVKTRRTALGSQGAGVEAVGFRKRRQLVFLANAYLTKHQLEEIPCRFDVVEVVETHDGFARFRLLKNAFDTSDAE